MHLHMQVLGCWCDLAVVRRLAGEHAEAERCWAGAMQALLSAQAAARRAAAAVGRRPLQGVTAEEEAARVELRMGMADAYQGQGRVSEAEALLRAALAWRARCT